MSENRSSPESLPNRGLIAHIALSPFRLLGLSANSSRKEIERARSKTVAYLKLGRAPEHTYDFESLLGRTELTRESFDASLSRLHTDESKLEEALFWLVEAKETDTICLGHLRKGNSALALEICGKLTDAGAIANEGTICLMLGNWKGFVQSRCKLFHEKNGSLFSAYVQLILGDKTWSDAPTFIAKYWQKVYSLLTTDERSALLMMFSESASEWETASSQLDALRTHVCKTLSEDLNRHLGISDESCRHSLEPVLHMREECLKLFDEIDRILGKKHEFYACLADTTANSLLNLTILFHNHHDHNWSDTEKQAVLSIIRSAYNLAVGRSIRDKCRKNETIIQDNFRKEQDQIFEQPFETLFQSFSATLGKTYNNTAAVVTAAQGFLADCLHLLWQKETNFTEQSQATRNHIVIEAHNALVKTVNAHKKGITGLSSYSFWAIYACLKDMLAFCPSGQAKNVLDDSHQAFRRSIALEEKRRNPFDLDQLLYNPAEILQDLHERNTHRQHLHPYPTRIPGIRGLARICLAVMLSCFLVVARTAHQAKVSNMRKTPTPTSPLSNVKPPVESRSRSADAFVPRALEKAIVPPVVPSPVGPDTVETVRQKPKPPRPRKRTTPPPARAAVPNPHSFLTNGDRPYDSYWIEDTDLHSDSCLTFENTTDKDVIVIMKDTVSGKPLRHVYIASHRTYTIYHIKNGSYKLYYIYGTEWDPGLVKGKVTGCFSRNLSCSKSNDIFEAYDNGYSHSIGNVRLYTIVTHFGTSGNADVDEALSDM